MSGGILEGMRVIEGSAFVAAPLAGMTLAQMGADVIRFDPLGGGLDYRRWPVTDGNESLFWAGLNKGKRSITVDMRSDRGRQLITDLICAPGEQGGLFVTNFPARGWLDYERLREKRPDLIMINLIGARDGSNAVDYTVNPAVGFPKVTGPVEWDEPVNHVLPAWDCISGQMLVVALLAAERHRRRTGEGQYVRIALKDVALAMLGNLGKVAEIVINGRRADEPTVEGVAKRHRLARGVRRGWTTAGPGPERAGQPLARHAGARRRPRGLVPGPRSRRGPKGL